jgi:type II secretory pathway pseudopilin PulG
MTELIVVIALVGILMAFAMPAFVEIFDRMHHDAAVRRITSDVREARSQAISMGWEYRVIGYRADAVNVRKNQYRVLARRSSAVSWPAENAATFASDTQRAGSWVDITEDYPGVDLDADVTRFQVTFDSRGAAPGAPAEFNPVRLIHHKGLETALTVSVIGGIRVE